MYDLILKNGNIYIDNELVKADLAITGEKIAAIGTNLTGKKCLELNSKWVLPGLIDAHTHFSLPFGAAVSADDFYTGSMAAAKGGVTTFIDFTAQQGEEGLFASLERRKKEAESLAAIDYSFHACISKFSDKVKRELPNLLSAGVNSLKVFMAYKHMMLQDGELFQLMEKCREAGILLTVHAENGAIIEDLMFKEKNLGKVDIGRLPEMRPEVTEVLAIKTLGALSVAANCPVYVVHVSSGKGAETLAFERRLGAPILGETCPQYLFLDDSYLRGKNGQYYGCCPPLRAKEGQEAIWQSLRTGDLSVIATDHCPFNKQDKDIWDGCITDLPMGLGGTEIFGELMLDAVHRGKIKLDTAIKAMCENPARIFGIYPEKGSLQVGTHADILVYDPDVERVISQKEMYSNNDYTPYEGFKVRGQNHMTILRGRPVYAATEGWLGEKGGGHLLKRCKFDATLLEKRGAAS
jgi:dihydropyrimidinase